MNAEVRTVTLVRDAAFQENIFQFTLSQKK